MKNLFLFYRPTDPYFSNDLSVQQQNKLVSPNETFFFRSLLDVFQVGSNSQRILLKEDIEIFKSDFFNFG